MSVITIAPKYIDYKKMSWLDRLKFKVIQLLKLTLIDYATFQYDYIYSTQPRVFIKFWSWPLVIKISLDEKELDLLIGVANEAKKALHKEARK